MNGDFEEGKVTGMVTGIQNRDEELEEVNNFCGKQYGLGII